MGALTSKQIKQYKEQGYIAPINILSLEEVKKINLETLPEVNESNKWLEDILGVILNENNINGLYITIAI